MVKKYKLTNANIKNQKAGATASGLNFYYPVAPNMTGLMPSNSNLMMRNPYGLGYNGMGMLPRSDPSVFVGIESPKTVKGGPIENVNLTFKEAVPKQSILTFQPTLPIIPNSYGMQLPVGFVANAPILINPDESKARMEITSNESDDIVTISGEQDKIKPIFDDIQKSNRVKIAQREVLSARKTLYDVEVKTVTGKDYDTDYKARSIEDIEKLTAVDLPDSIRKYVIKIKKAENALRKAKKEAKMADDETIVPDTELIALDELFDLPAVINLIKTKYTYTDTDFAAKSSKKNNLQLLLGIPYRNGLSYGPSIYGL